VPADHAGDPLLTNWSKPSYNPIVNNTQRDPSTAWQTAAGEWRLTNYEGKIFSSLDFVTWAEADGGAQLWVDAECPDFFPRPRNCDGNGCDGPLPPGAVLPTHVHKESNGGDFYTAGVYEEGAVGTLGTWTPIPGVPRQPLQGGIGSSNPSKFYASKSFHDPVQDRRIYYGWAIVPPASTQTLPLDTRWHTALQRLTFSPIPELAALRASPQLASMANVQLAANASVWLGDWAPGVGNQSELRATFTLPSSGAPVDFGVAVLVGAGAGGAGKANVSTAVVFHFDPVAFNLSVNVGGVNGPPQNLSYYMPGIDLPGADYNVRRRDGR
jgi:hypothetical protein